MLTTILRGCLGKRHLTLLCLVILAVGCNTTKAPGPTASLQPSLTPISLTPSMIEPGVGIKEVKLGQTRTEVEQSLGSPSEQDPNPYVKGQTYLLFHSKGIELTLQDDLVQVITLHVKQKKWSAYSGGTTEGVGVTSTWEEVEKAFGSPSDQSLQALTYPDKGLKFRFDQKNEDDAKPRVESLSLIVPVAAK